MKRIQLFALVPLFALSLIVFSGFTNAESTRYKCMIQMKNYEGEGAYVVISLVDANDNYVETLYVQGDDDEWYFDITEWWSFYGKKRNNLDAITGETLSGGERTVTVLDIDKKYLDSGYKIRFETAVEDQEYHVKDLEIALNTETLSTKFDGQGFIRYVRMMPQ